MTEAVATLDRPAPRLDAWIAMLITLVVFSLVLLTPYSVIDDRTMLRDNPELINATASGMWKQLATPQHNIYAPLTFGLWYAIAAVTSDGQALPATGFKIASWLTHGFGTLAAWWVLWLLVRNRLGAMVGALVVGLHPLQVESVAWTTGTKDVLCGALSSLGVALYLHGITDGGRRHIRRAVVCGVLAVAAKPTGVVLPVILLAVDLAVRSVPVSRRARDLWPFLPASVIGALVIINVQHAADVSQQPLWARPLIALDSVSFYIRRAVLPWPLLVDYGRTPDWVRHSGQLAWTCIIPVLSLVALLLTRNRLLLLAGAMFVIPILPVSGLVSFDMQQFSTVADHYAYQSLLGLGLIVAVLLTNQPRARWAGAAIVVVLAALSVRYINVWRVPETLYATANQYAPHGVMSRGALATLAGERNDLPEAERLLRQVLEEQPRVDAYQHLANVLLAQRRMTEAAEAAKRALSYHSSKTNVQTVRLWLDLAARLNDTDLALAAATHWSGLEPQNPAPRRLIEQIVAARARAASTRPAEHPSTSPATRSTH